MSIFFLCKDTQKIKVFKKKALSLQQISKNRVYISKWHSKLLLLTFDALSRKSVQKTLNKAEIRIE